MTVSFSEIRAQNPQVYDEACPTRVVLDHVMSKWGVLVLMVLTDGTTRWSDLRRSVQGISEKMLASTLRTLEKDGLIVRTAYPEVPPRVEYALSPLGDQLMERMMPLMAWIGDNATEIVER